MAELMNLNEEESDENELEDLESASKEVDEDLTEAVEKDIKPEIDELEDLMTKNGEMFKNAFTSTNNTLGKMNNDRKCMYTAGGNIYSTASKDEKAQVAHQ